MTSDQLQAISNAFSVSHLLDIFTQLAPFILSVVASLLAVSIISSLIKQLRNHLMMKKFEQEELERYDDEAYILDLQNTLDHYEEYDKYSEPEEAEWHTLEVNEEYKRMTGEYYIDPQEIRDHYAVRKS